VRARLLSVALSVGALLVGGAAPALAAPTLASPTTVAAHRTTPLDQCSAASFTGDPRLGPAELPVFGRVGFELFGYRRTGGMAPARFLATYYDSAAGSYRYPPQNGYLLTPGGRPIQVVLTLLPGQRIDRFGSEFGSFLAPEGSPYGSRSIPPASLNSNPAAGCNYHDYRVLRPFRVDAGPIAPWFGQPGLGLQYQLDATLVPGAPTPINVMWLLDNGYLERLV
jgi:hypothetical protein